MGTLEKMDLATTAKVEHDEVCGFCREKAAPTGSGMCIVGFRLFLDWSHAVTQRAKSIPCLDP